MQHSQREWKDHGCATKMVRAHMNGRVQDPYTGRFVSADPTVPDPFYSQAFNRFAYVYNNPMNSVDPSGYCPSNGDPLNLADCPNSAPEIVICSSGSSGCLPTTTNQQTAPAAQTGSTDQTVQTTTDIGNIEVDGTKPQTQSQAAPGASGSAHCASNSCTENGIAASGYGSTSTVPGSGMECWNGDCGNGVQGNMDYTDGATTWNGTFSNNDASQPSGFLGLIPQHHQLICLMHAKFFKLHDQGS